MSTVALDEGGTLCSSNGFGPYSWMIAPPRLGGLVRSPQAGGSYAHPPRRAECGMYEAKCGLRCPSELQPCVVPAPGALEVLPSEGPHASEWGGVVTLARNDFVAKDACAEGLAVLDQVARVAGGWSAEGTIEVVWDRLAYAWAAVACGDHTRWAIDRGLLPQLGLSDADLRGANLVGADLRGADLRGADLRGADLHNANLSEVDLRGANLAGANFYNASLYNADLSGASLAGATLVHANLIYANLAGADLSGATGLKP